MVLPSKLVQAVIPTACIREVPWSNPSHITRCPVLFVQFIHLSRYTLEYHLRLGHNHLQILSISLVILTFDTIHIRIAQYTVAK